MYRCSAAHRATQPRVQCKTLIWLLTELQCSIIVLNRVRRVDTPPEYNTQRLIKPYAHLMFAVLLQKTKCAPPGEVPASMFTSLATLASVGGEDARPYLPELMPALVTGLANAPLMRILERGVHELHMGTLCALIMQVRSDFVIFVPTISRCGLFCVVEDNKEKIINSLLVPYRLQHLGEYNHMKAPPNVVYTQLKYMWAQGGSLAELRQFTISLAKDLQAESLGHTQRAGQRLNDLSKLLARCYFKQGFFRPISLRDEDVLQDTRRLLMLWFKYGAHDEISHVASGFSMVKNRYMATRYPTRAYFLPCYSQLISHLQPLIYLLTVGSKSLSESRKNAVLAIMNRRSEHSATIVEQARIEWIRVAILWQELRHEGLEEASRLYYTVRNPAGMLTVLEPLHEMLQAGSQTVRETSVFGVELRHAWEACRRYRQFGETRELNSAWGIYFAVFQKIEKQLPQLTVLDLQCLAGTAQRPESRLCGTYQSGREVIYIANFAPRLTVISAKRRMALKGSDGQDYYMVGHIPELGDRHPSNLMLERKMGKVVRIDFCDYFQFATMAFQYCSAQFREQVEFDSNTARLQSIQLDHGISFVFERNTVEILISSTLLKMLQRFHSNSLEELIIGVIHTETPQLTVNYASIYDFARVLDLPHYARLRILQFRSFWEEKGTGKDFTSILIDQLPPTARRVAGLIEQSEC
ncbi:hypothetical protein C8R44DRAFT_893996 [Mycena epipterygia]|nr:hypothetical protein C8R44DRAFT_893996 [Mycena epipterygia]